MYVCMYVQYVFYMWCCMKEIVIIICHSIMMLNYLFICKFFIKFSVFTIFIIYFHIFMKTDLIFMFGHCLSLSDIFGLLTFSSSH